jgi:predicted DNA binding CopG/RHH family protein
MTNDSDRLGEAVDYYETHDISQDMDAGTWERHEGKQAASAMSGFNTRLPTAVLNDVRAIARARGITTGAWIREVIEAAVSSQKTGDDLVPMSVLLAAAEEYHHRRAS